MLIDNTAVYADWLNNDNLKNKLASDLTILIYKEGYPPEWDEEVFLKVLSQVENYKKNSSYNNRQNSINVELKIENHYHGNIDNLNINAEK